MNNPTPEALAQAQDVVLEWGKHYEKYPKLVQLIAIALTEQAREIEQLTQVSDETEILRLDACQRIEHLEDKLAVARASKCPTCADFQDHFENQKRQLQNLESKVRHYKRVIPKRDARITEAWNRAKEIERATWAATAGDKAVIAVAERLHRQQMRNCPTEHPLGSCIHERPITTFAKGLLDCARAAAQSSQK